VFVVGRVLGSLADRTIVVVVVVVGWIWVGGVDGE
jgi:hypothetical protein